MRENAAVTTTSTSTGNTSTSTGNTSTSTGNTSRRASRENLIHISTQTNTFPSSKIKATAAGMMATVSAMLPTKKFARIALVTCLLVAVIVVYVTLFKHPPPDQLMKMNGAAGGGRDFNLRAFGHSAQKSHNVHDRRRLAQDDAAEKENDDDEVINSGKFEEEDNEEDKAVEKKRKSIWDLIEDDDEEEEKEKNGENDTKHKKASAKSAAKAAKTERKTERKPERKSEKKRERKTGRRSENKDGGGEMKGKAKWDKFVADNQLTVIGIVFDACEDPTEQLGTVAMMPDKEDGGVKSRTFYNFTLDREIDEGATFNIDVKYNGQDLYDNWWEVCELEEDLEPEERTFVCPIKPGRMSVVKDRHIPGLIPTGRYQTKAWVKDAKGEVLVCGFSDFVI